MRPSVWMRWTLPFGRVKSCAWFCTPPVSDCKVEVSVCVEYDARAVVMPGCEIGFMWGFVDYLLVGPGVVLDVTAHEAGHCRGPTLPFYVGDFMAVGEVNPGRFQSSSGLLLRPLIRPCPSWTT